MRCRHCWLAPVYESKATPSHAVLDVELFRSIVQQGKPLGMGSVKLTGGEPLMHPEIRKILEIVREEDLGLTVETNGVLCTEELARDMAQCKRTFVSVSVDGAKAETHEWVRGVKGSFEHSLQGVRNLVKTGFKPQIIMSLMQCNREQIEDLVRMAKDLGAGSVKFNLIQPTARGEHLHAIGAIIPVEELIEIGRWVETDLSKSAGLRTIFHHPPAFRPMSSMFGENGDGCSVCGILGILGVLANGSYALCGIGENVPELIFGHAAKDKLDDVWNENPVLNEIRDGLPDRLQGVCGDCLMQARCLGSCIAQNYYSNYDLWAPFWFCKEAHEKGKFPESRLKPVTPKL